MLTSEQSIVAFDRGRVLPDRLTTGAHAGYPAHAEAMLDLYRGGVGLTRRELHRGVHRILSGEPDCPVRRIEAFCRLLDDASEFDGDRSGKAARLRRRVFRLAAPLHPLVASADRLFENEAAVVRERVAGEVGRPWEEIEEALYADVIEFHRLRGFDGYADGRSLLSRYNVAQVQACLYRAEEMTIRATRDLRPLLQHAKLARLMHEVRRLGPDLWELRFAGPASILRATRRYGVLLADYLPAVLACRGWRLRAVIRWRGKWKARLELSEADGLRSHVAPPSEFDSGLEAAFAARWGDGERKGWRLLREGAVLERGQKVFVPDFLLRHRNGREVFLEIVGFWTPEYLAAKAESLEAFRDRAILLAVAGARTGEFEFPLPTVVFRKALTLEAVLEGLRGMGGGG